MGIQGTIRIPIRYDGKEQYRRLKLAAKRLRWPLNRFMLVASERLANHVLSAEFDPFSGLKEGSIVAPAVSESAAE